MDNKENNLTFFDMSYLNPSSMMSGQLDIINSGIPILLGF